MKQLQVSDLSVEFAINPVVLDVSEPRLSWKLSSSQRGERQTAYHIRVASDSNLLADAQPDIWDSGVVAGIEQMTLHEYRKQYAKSEYNINSELAD